MTHQEKLELEKLRLENKKLKKENEIKNKEIDILKVVNKEKDEIINDLDIKKYKEKYVKTLSDFNNLSKIDKEKDEEIKELKKKVNFLEKQLLINNVIINKDSSNSSKPSSTNGFKKVITNRREKSIKKQGGQIGHIGCGLTQEKVEKILKSKDIEIEIIEINKNGENEEKPFKIRRVFDIKIIKTCKEYRYYPDKNGKYNIPLEHNNLAQYGTFLKSLCVNFHVGINISIDSIVSIINNISNINLSKGTIINWIKSATKKLKPQISNIHDNLLISYYINHDESQIKIDGENNNLLCASNKEYTRLWISKRKSKNALENIGFLKHFNGTIVKDGTRLYNDFGKNLSQCISHILRYIKGIYDFVNHVKSKEMADFLKNLIKERDIYILDNKEKFEKEVYDKYIENYKTILKAWKKEWMSSNSESNPVYEEERKLLQRFEEDQKEILYFLKDFKVPATNNQAEADLRPVKIKQKIGKFRSTIGADCYAEIRSCINTYKKHNESPFLMIHKAFENNIQLV